MNDTMKLWLIGMGILPEQVEDDKRFQFELGLKDGRGAWERLLSIRAMKGINTYPEFNTAAAQLEFMSIVAGKPTLWM